MKAGFAILLVSVLSAPCFAEQVQRQTVTGWVVDYEARPVGGAMVTCYGSSIGERKYEPPGGVQTTSEGRFSFQIDKENSSLLLVAGKAGLALGWKSIDHAGDLIPTIRLGKPNRFRATVVDEVGRPVSGARVRIYLKNEMLSHSAIGPLAPESWFVTETNARGQFTFDNVPGGSTADFGVDAPGKASILTFCDFGLGEGEQFAVGRTDIRIELPPGAHIKGQVVDEITGRGVADVEVLAVPHSYAGWCFRRDPIQTDPNGHFELAGLAPDKYTLQAVSSKDGAGTLTVTIEPELGIYNVKIPLRAIPLEVTVHGLENEGPIENAEVRVEQKDPASGYPAFKQEMVTDVNGLARLFVPPGECEISAFKAGYGAIIQPQSLQVHLGKKVRHEVSLPRNACILSGEVVDGQGHTISNVQVMQMGFGPRTLTDTNGRFDTSHIGYYMSRLPSKIRVLARHISSGLGGIGTLEDPDKSGRPRGRITLKPAHTLTGRVTDPNGKSIPAAYVKLLQGRYRTPITEVLSDANGAYYIPSVPNPGDNPQDSYAVTACAEDFGIAQIISIPWHDNTDEPVHLDPIVLPPADKAISGVVEDSNDQHVAGARVWIYGPRLSTTVSMPPCGKTLTDARGRFSIEGMCKEPLRIWVTLPPPQKVTGTTWAYGGNENVKVVLGRRLQFTPSPIGKPLPELKDLGINLSPANANDKVILVCFFDMNQRPSRNAIIQLARQAEELKQKGVTVIAIQTSKVAEDTLNKWTKDQSISFPVGMVRGDEEEIRFTWGVKSLPWLILTDKEHIVRVEGFALAELDEKLKANK